MPTLALSATHLTALVLAAAGAVLFGLAAVRQHMAVQQTMAPARRTARAHFRAAWALARQPEWLVGAAQAGLGGALHVVALALAPITVVQPVGVLAVPVTVVATVLHRRRRVGRRQLAGALTSVVGIAGLTVVLLAPATGTAATPGWSRLAATVAVVVGLGVFAVCTGGRGRPPVRCLVLAATAAVLFGLESVLVRAIGLVVTAHTVTPHTVTTHTVTTHTVTTLLPVLLTALVGIAAALPLGVWSTQTAYVVGAPSVVVCCLTLIDPVAAVVGGRLLLHDGGPIAGLTLVLALACTAVTASGVVLLSGDSSTESRGEGDGTTARSVVEHDPGSLQVERGLDRSAR